MEGTSMDASSSEAFIGDVVASVPAWLEQLRGSLEHDIVGDKPVRHFQQTADEQKNGEWCFQAQMDLISSIDIEEKKDPPSDINAPVPCFKQMPSNDSVTSESASEPYSVHTLATKVIDEFKSNSFRDRFGKFFFHKTRPDSPIGELKRYESKIRSCITLHEKHMVKLSSTRRRVEQSMKDDLARWDRWAMDTLSNAGRTYYETCRLHLDALIQVEVHTVDWLTRMLSQLSDRILSNNLDFFELDASCLIQYDPAVSRFVPVEDLVVPEPISSMKRNCASLEQVLKQLETQYEDQQKESVRVETPAERRLKLHNLVSIGLTDSRVHATDRRGFYYHHPDRIAQTAFNRLMLDERQRIGQLIKQWMSLLRDALKDPLRKVTAEAINAFLEYLVIFLTRAYHIQTDGGQLDTIRLHVHRMIYPRITRTLGRLQTSIEVDNDTKFRKKIRWMWCLSQEQLGIRDDFRCPHEYHLAAPPPGLMTSPVNQVPPSPSEHVTSTDSGSALISLPSDFPFHTSITTLSQLETQCVPTDMLYTLVQTIASIHQSCRTYSGNEEAVVDADALFPIVVWVVVHAYTSNINCRLGHILRSISDEKQRNFGESGFSLAIIEASVSYILELLPSKFGLPFSISDDPDIIASRTASLANMESQDTNDVDDAILFSSIPANDQDPFSERHT